MAAGKLGQLQIGSQALDVDGFECEVRPDGFHAVRLFLGEGYRIYHLTLDSTVPDRWFFSLADCAVAQVEPELLDDQAAFDARFSTALEARLTLLAEPPGRSEHTVQRFSLEATAAPPAFAIRLDLDAGGALELRGGSGWTLLSDTGVRVLPPASLECHFRYPWPLHG
jgi:hypothetical protein